MAKLMAILTSLSFAGRRQPVEFVTKEDDEQRVSIRTRGVSDGARNESDDVTVDVESKSWAASNRTMTHVTVRRESDREPARAVLFILTNPRPATPDERAAEQAFDLAPGVYLVTKQGRRVPLADALEAVEYVSQLGDLLLAGDRQGVKLRTPAGRLIPVDEALALLDRATAPVCSCVQDWPRSRGGPHHPSCVLNVDPS